MIWQVILTIERVNLRIDNSIREMKAPLDFESERISVYQYL